MQYPLVSIIVVSYNHAHFLRENLDSIKRQTYPNIQLIVADDASTDNSVEVYENWLKENNYTAHKNFHTKNTGLANTLNECIDYIKGKYVKFIAADDYLHPESIEKCVYKLEELGNDYGMIFTDTWAVNNQSEIQGDIANYNALGTVSKEEFREKLVLGNRIAALTVVIRTDVLKETGKYPAHILTEDYYRWLKINEKYWIAYIPEKLSYYRLHDTNISKTKTEKILEDDFFLKISFDKNGNAKSIIKNYIIRKYSRRNLSENIKKSYSEYQYKNKTLNWFVQNNVPFLVYKIFKKLS